jgi:hypothetical protein
MDKTMAIGIGIAVVVIGMIIGVAMLGGFVEMKPCKCTDGISRDIPDSDWYSQSCKPVDLARTEYRYGNDTAVRYHDLCRCYEVFTNKTIELR